MINIELDGIMNFVTDDELHALEPECAAAHDALSAKTGPGAEFTGWVTLPRDYDREEFSRIKLAAEKIRSDSELLVVIGIGGSYLGARAAAELLCPDAPQLLFAGTNLSADYAARLLRQLEGRDFSINVVSKSGRTLEPAAALRIFRRALIARYGIDEANRRTYATTDKANGALYELAVKNGWERFIVPDDVGGRYSVLTAVGLLPMAAAGIDIDEVMRGAFDAMQRFDARSPENPVWQYAAARNALYRRGKKIELFAHFEPAAKYVAEWFKQLYGESEGKNGLGIFPASAEFTADLHSLGQYIQQGERTLMETMLIYDSPRETVLIPEADDDTDGLGYLAGKPLSYLNSVMQQAVAEAHIAGGVPVIRIRQDRISEYSFGEMVYFFELACGISGYMLGVSPFDQPGVEAYKSNVNKLLKHK